MDNSSPAPKERNPGLDVARGLAVMLMILTNYRLVMSWGDTSPAWLSYPLVLMEGRGAVLFVILAGMGMSLLSARGRMQNLPEIVEADRRTLLKRALFLFVVGFIYTPLWPADILHFYGLYIAFGSCFIAASNRSLLSAAGAVLAAFCLLYTGLDYGAGWNFETQEYLDFWSPAGLVRHLFFNGYHPFFPWAAFLLFGMWLGRSNLSDPENRKRLLTGGAIALILAETVSALAVSLLPGPSTGPLWDWLHYFLLTKAMPPGPLFVISTLGSGTVVIVLCVIVSQRFRDSGAIRSLAATGGLTLTNYVSHVVVGMGIMEGLGYLYEQPLWFAVVWAMVFIIISVSFSLWWGSRFGRGPLERLMRRVT